MARRRESRRWHIGDEVLVPFMGRLRTSWQRGIVEAVRGDTVIVSCYGWCYERPSGLLRPMQHVARWSRWWGHDKSKDRIGRPE